MSFFDSKEEVINIELTQYGKEAFAKGKLQPKYYAFYDDDIIYDMNYGSFSENQNDIEARILENSIFLKPFPTLTGSYVNKSEIGTCDSLNQYMPSWDLKILEGSTIYSSNYNKSFPNILQINLNPSKITVSGNSLANLNINAQNIILELQEKNVTSYKENFEIELYEVEDDDDLISLPFGEQKNNVKNGILIDREIMLDSPENNPEYAEHYFSFTRDKKIDNNKIDRLKNNLNKIYK